MATTKPIKDKQQLQQFRNYYKDVIPHPRNYALIVLGLNSALRISDLLSLRWDDLYDTSRHCYRTHLSIREKKTGKQNTFLLNSCCKEALQYYRQTLPTPSKDSYLFASQKPPHAPISRSQAFRIIKHAAKECGLDDGISCHSLRKTFGYNAWNSGIPPVLLMNIYNHSSYEITKHYLGIEQAEKDEVYRTITL